MSKIAALENLSLLLGDLDSASSLLTWDQDVNMPPAGAEARSHQLATLSRLSHERFVSDEVGCLLQEAAAECNGAPEDGYEASLVRLMQRDYDRAVKVPTTLVEELSRVRSLAQGEWIKARAQNDYAMFQPWLARILDLTRQFAEHLGYEEHIYDALLQAYEPGMTSRDMDGILENLRQELVPVIRAIAGSSAQVDDAILLGDFPLTTQRAFVRQVAAAIGFDFDRGRLDVAVHPYAMGLNTGDVRLTTRYSTGFINMALFGTMHEAGHGMYEQGFHPDLKHTTLAGAASMGIHESQSRLWENQLGRSRAFWQYYFPQLQQLYPQHYADVDLEPFYRAINRVKPDFIRVEADEVTYNLHIMLRYELEKGLLADEISLNDLPALWDDKMEAYLGIRPPDAARGVLQDVHWSIGLLGYFPSYTLGNLVAAQLYEAMLRDHPNFPEKVRRGEFGDLLAWMRQNVHQHGRIYDPQDLVRRVTGEPIQSRSYMAYIKRKYGEIYDF